ncbi:MAG TPA: hypothetical protein VFL59_15100 [Candidatus Nanopelagicales bacterium]|nr:hypothetical protein [Candidatus Nanopelagicales bacterium]
MPRTTDTPVVLLYVHPLLGIGLADHLRVTTGIDVLAVPLRDRRAVAAALALAPRVVIYENASELDLADLARLAPDARLIDVSGAVAPAGALVPEQAAAPATEMLVDLVGQAYSAAG